MRQRVGSYDADSLHGFLYSNGTYTDLGEFLHRYDINLAGQIVGSYSPPLGPQPCGFLFSNGTYIDFGQGTARGINAVGQLTGSVTFDGNNSVTAFRYSNGQMTNLGAFLVAGRQKAGESMVPGKLLATPRLLTATLMHSFGATERWTT